MDKLKKRLDELETIQNNIRLLTELLAHYKPDSGDGEKALMQVLSQGKSCIRAECVYFLGRTLLPLLNLGAAVTQANVLKSMCSSSYKPFERN